MRILDPFAVDASAEIGISLVDALAFLSLRHHVGKQLESSLDFRVFDGFVTIEQMTPEMNNGFSNL